MKKVGLALLVVLALAAYGGVVHASGDAGPHSATECLLCGFCSVMAYVLS